MHVEPLRKKFRQPVYNLGTDEYLSMRDLMDQSGKWLPARASIRFEETPPAESGDRECIHAHLDAR